MGRVYYQDSCKKNFKEERRMNGWIIFYVVCGLILLMSYKAVKILTELKKEE